MPPALRVVSAAAVIPLIMTLMGTGGTNAPIAARPAVGETVDEAPSSVTIAMQTKVAGPAVITVKDSAGKVVSEPNTTQLSTNISADLQFGLNPGTYTVSYRIEGTKGPEGGSYQFVYRSGSVTQKGIKTWRGYREIPKAVSLPDDDEREAAFEASASNTPSPDNPAPSGGSTSDVPSDTGPGASQKARDSGSTFPWLWLAGGALLLGIGAVMALRKRAASDQAADE